MPSLSRLLKAHKLASRHSPPSGFVFATSTGRPLSWRNLTRRGLEAAVKRAGLDATGRRKLRFHDCRDTFASLLIAEGFDVVFVSRQLGHASPTITLSIYADLFDRARHAEQATAKLEASFGSML
jgi:integrase